MKPTPASEQGRNGWRPELPQIRPDEWFFLRAMGHARAVCDAIKLHYTGTETYYPVARSQGVVRHLETTIERPVFPGYVYARFVRYPDWHHMQQYCGAACIMRQEVDGVLRPLRERESIIADIRRREAEGEFGVSAVCPTLEMLIGSMVRIKSGVLNGQFAKVHSIQNNEVLVRLWFMGKKQLFAYKIEELLTDSTLSEKSA